MVTVEFHGIPQLLQVLQRLGPRALPAAGQALYEEGNRIMGDSVRLVPVDTGLLRSTAHVERPAVTATAVEVELRYGSHGLAPYAIRIHEDVDMNHPNGGTAKFLQNPLLAALAGMPARLGTDLLVWLRR